MSENQRATTRKLQPEDRQQLERKLFTLTSSLKEGSTERDIYNRPGLIEDSASISSRARQIKSLLDADKSLEARTPYQRSKLSKRLVEIRNILLKHVMYAREIYMSPKANGTPDFERAVQKAMFWNSDKCANLVTEWRDIMNRLEPDDPTADDVSSLEELATKTKVVMAR